MTCFDIVYEKMNLREWIGFCQKKGHKQQVAFSTYHGAITQICFTCKRIVTEMKEE